MSGKIDAFVDCGMPLNPSVESGGWLIGLVSPYSYYATLYLRKNRKALESHGVEVE
jgi:hypothetical protein